MNESTLKQTNTAFTCVGKVYEMKLTKEDLTIDAGPKDDKKKVETELIKGPITIKTEAGPVDFFVYETEIGYNGKENFRWPMAVAMLDKWNPMIGGNGEAPTKVCISGELNPRDQVDDRTNQHRYTLGYRITSANTRVTDEDAEGMTVKLNAYVDNIEPEIKDEEETGRLKMRLLGATYDGKCYPIDVIVDEDAADLVLEGDDEMEAFAKEQTRTNIELEYVCNGGANEEKPANEHKRTLRKTKGPEVRTSNGARKIEYFLASVDDKAVEEPDELTYEDDEGNIKETITLWINPATMKKAKKARAMMIEELVKNGGSKSNGGKASLKDRKAQKKAEKASAATASHFAEDDDSDDDPF